MSVTVSKASGYAPKKSAPRPSAKTGHSKSQKMDAISVSVRLVHGFAANVHAKIWFAWKARFTQWMTAAPDAIAETIAGIVMITVDPCLMTTALKMTSLSAEMVRCVSVMRRGVFPAYVL